MSDYKVNKSEIEKTFRVIVGDDIAECRAIKVHEEGKKPFIARGWFKNAKKLAEVVAATESDAFYITLNPVKRELMGRSDSVLTKGSATADSDIICRLWLLIDLDGDASREHRQPTQSTRQRSQSRQDLQALWDLGEER